MAAIATEQLRKNLDEFISRMERGDENFWYAVPQVSNRRDTAVYEAVVAAGQWGIDNRTRLWSGEAIEDLRERGARLREQAITQGCL